MSDVVNFSVNPKLTRILGETYRSSEAAIKELVDNAWDADADHVWIQLPTIMSKEPLTVRDDGSGMTELELRNEYLKIASDRRTRAGERTVKYKRRVKGRKGIGKFAGLMIADHMHVETIARGVYCSLHLNKDEFGSEKRDLEHVPVPFTTRHCDGSPSGTTITMRDLNDKLKFPEISRLRELLVYEYGRLNDFIIYVDGVELSVEDIPGPTTTLEPDLPIAGRIELSFTVAEGKKSIKLPGILIKVDGKAIGKPTFFGLENNEEIPAYLLSRIYGELNLFGAQDVVTADWGSMIENSKLFEEVKNYASAAIRNSISETHTRDIDLQRKRIERKIEQALQRLPEFRRKYASVALHRILNKYYGESEEKIDIVSDVALDALEHDSYWAVIENIKESSYSDVSALASSLEQFGLLELSLIGAQATGRLEFLKYLDQLSQDPATLESQMHKALETNLWTFGRKYSTISSNESLKTVIERYCDTKYKGLRAAKRPDLLLSQDHSDRFLLIEFKRPSHNISRDDIAQADKYRDDLSPTLPSDSDIEVILIGKGRSIGLDVKNLSRSLSIMSYATLVSNARSEYQWVISSVSRRHEF